MFNTAERFPSFPEEDLDKLSEDSKHDRPTHSPDSVSHTSESADEPGEVGFHSEAQVEEVQERIFEHTPEAREHREAALAELDRKMREFRKEFAEQFAKDQAREAEDYFAADFSRAENGEQVKPLLRRLVIDKVRAGMYGFIRTGNEEGIPTIYVDLKRALYSHQGAKKEFLIGISMSTEEGKGHKEYVDLVPQVNPTTHSNKT